MNGEERTETKKATSNPTDGEILHVFVFIFKE
jgi:hypothetical protein